MSKPYSIIKIILVTLATLWVVVCLAIFGAIGYNIYKEKSATPTSSVIVTPPTEQDPALVGKAAAMGIDISQLTLKYGETSQPNRLAEFTKITNTDSSISYQIVIRPNQTNDELFTSFAHEYYHYYWDTHPDVKGAIPVLQALYAAYQPLQTRMQVYVDEGLSPDSEHFANELLAISCTEVRTSVITPNLQSYCEAGVPNRSMITTSL
jgi:hypothetical protein